MTDTQKMYNAMYRLFKVGSYTYQIENAFIFYWESDFFCMTKSGYTLEVEIKVSRKDYKADFLKDKHNLFSCKEDVGIYSKVLCPNGGWDYGTIKGVLNNHPSPYPFTRISWADKRTKAPNKFAYAVPEGLVTEEEVPEYAGLIWVNDKGRARWIKKPPYLHKTKMDLNNTLLSKFYWKTMNQRHEIDNLKIRIKQLEKQNSLT